MRSLCTPILFVCFAACDVDKPGASSDTGELETETRTDSPPEGKDTGDPVTDDTSLGKTEVIDVDGDGYAEDVDCDDEDASIHPDAEETCDGVDQDCDGAVDEDAVDAETWYLDSDGDGWGTAKGTVLACEMPTGHTAQEGDCDDADAEYHPGAKETCEDPHDYNCDGSISYVDADKDGVAACVDCDDSDPTAFPGGVEVCDGADNDCNTLVDDAAKDAGAYYADADGDGYGDVTTVIDSCDSVSGYVTDATDCDDGDATVNPAQDEVCADGLDNDCSGVADDICGTLYDAELVTWLSGNSVDDKIGADVDTADVNGDGNPDLLVLSREEIVSGGGTGRGYVVHGPLTSTAEVESASVAIIDQTASIYSATRSFKSLGDLDADGYDDIIFADPSANGLTGTGNIYYGPVSGTFDTAGTADIEIRDQSAYLIGFYYGVSRGGTDLDGDGNDDLLVGQQFYPNLTDQPGAAFVWYGPVTLSSPWDAVGYAPITEADATIEGDTARANFGDNVQGLGDVTGDGIADLGVLAMDEGLFVIEGSATRLSGDYLASTLTVAHLPASSSYGQRLGPAGDQNGDGHEDIVVSLVGATHDAYVFHGPLSGTLSTSGAAASFDGTDPSSTVPAAFKVDADGDVDNDGVNDFLVSAADYAVVLGPASGAIDLDTDANIVIVNDSGATTEAVSWVGDHDGDGLDDFLIGQPDWDDPSAACCNEGGRAALVTGDDVTTNMVR